MADEEIDLYGDLDDYDLAEKLKKTEKKCSDLQGRLCKCEEQQSIKDKEFQILNKDFRNMNANLNSLFQTAKTEIQRKDNQIRDLRKELDNVRFRRNQRMQNEKNSQLRHIATQTEMLNEPKILQENQMKNEGVLKNANERTEHLNENGRHSIRNSFSSSRNELPHVNGNTHKEHLKDKNSSELSREKDSRSRHWKTDDTHRSRQKNQRTVDRQNPERTKRQRSRSISTDRKRSRRSQSKQTDRLTNRFAERLSPEKNTYKETHRTSVGRSDYKRRSPESTSKGDLRDKTQRRLRKSEERHSEHSKHKAENENVVRRERHLLDATKKIPQINVEGKPTSEAYMQKSNGFELVKNKVENCIPTQGDKAKKYENLEDGEIIEENSSEASPAEPITNKEVEKIEQIDSEATTKEPKKTANRGKSPLDLKKTTNSVSDVKFEPERALIHVNKSTEEYLSTTKSNSDSEVQISEVNYVKSIMSKNVSTLLKIDLPIDTENLSTDEPQFDKMQQVSNSCTSSDKNDDVSVNTALNTSGLDTSKVVKNISTSSTDYTLVEDDENNDVIIYVSRKKRKKKKSLGNN